MGWGVSITDYSYQVSEVYRIDAARDNPTDSPSSRSRQRNRSFVPYQEGRRDSLHFLC